MCARKLPTTPGRFDWMFIPGLIAVPGILFTLIGVALLAQSGATKSHLKYGVETDAAVLETFTKHDTHLHKTYYYARVRYTTRSGKTIEARAEISEADFRRAKDGAPRIRVLYSKRKPDKVAGRGVLKQKKSDTSVGGWITLVLGVLIVLGSIPVGRYFYRRAR